MAGVGAGVVGSDTSHPKPDAGEKTETPDRATTETTQSETDEESNSPSTTAFDRSDFAFDRFDWLFSEHFSSIFGGDDFPTDSDAPFAGETPPGDSDDGGADEGDHEVPDETEADDGDTADESDGEESADSNDSEDTTDDESDSGEYVDEDDSGGEDNSSGEDTSDSDSTDDADSTDDGDETTDSADDSDGTDDTDDDSDETTDDPESTDDDAPDDTPDSEESPDDSTGDTTNDSDATDDSTSTDDGDTTDDAALDSELVEQYVHEAVNEERAERGLAELEWDDDLSTIAADHSEDMAERGYFSHTSPEGDTFADRYEEYGYECRAYTDGGAYYTGGENIASTYYETNVRTDGGDTHYYDTERELADGVVDQWMNSEGHRENILQEHWNTEGIGVYVTDDDQVYVTQNFC